MVPAKKPNASGSRTEDGFEGATSPTKVTEHDKSLALVKSLVGRAATIWLLENESRPSPPAKKDLETHWVQDSCTQCFLSVCETLRKFRDSDEAVLKLNEELTEDDADLSWFIEPEIGLVALGKARANYASWNPPLCDDEWTAEVTVLKELTRRFAIAERQFKLHPEESPLSFATLVARAAVDKE